MALSYANPGKKVHEIPCCNPLPVFMRYSGKHHRAQAQADIFRGPVAAEQDFADTDGFAQKYDRVETAHTDGGYVEIPVFPEAPDDFMKRIMAGVFDDERYTRITTADIEVEFQNTALPPEIDEHREMHGLAGFQYGSEACRVAFA